MPTDPPTTFADRLRTLREAAGLSQYALAAKAGVGRAALSRLEMGDRLPSWDTAVSLAGALGCRLDDFLPTSEAQPKKSRKMSGKG
jgi:transcriptional regulator with XRE-family HTH domain